MGNHPPPMFPFLMQYPLTSSSLQALIRGPDRANRFGPPFILTTSAVGIVQCTFFMRSCRTLTLTPLTPRTLSGTIAAALDFLPLDGVLAIADMAPYQLDGLTDRMIAAQEWIMARRATLAQN